jgi:hypothetical protein
MELVFENQNAFTEHIVTALSARFPSEELRQVGNLIAPDFTEKREPPPRPGSAGLRVPVLRWIIKDDDLKLLESIFDGLKAGAAAGLIVGEPTTATIVTGVVGIAAAAAKLGRQMLRKGRKLTELEYQVLAALSSAGNGMTETQLVAWMEITTRRTKSEAEIRDAINSLQSIALADGTLTSLVSRDAAGLLRAVGV